ncbi:MAG TPA: ABC transporter permease [Candidatus Sulfotelmatobacter sp.]|nr:ABC transporter permease [Candidatus Sulfotelmatobacter sp.]
MKTVRALLSRIAGLFDRERRDAELQDELQSVLQMHIDDNLRSGLSPEQARRQALIKLGSIDQVTEAYREQRGVPILETMAQDVRFAVRGMRKNLGFTAVALLTLALGIGANTALFSVVNGVLLNPLPYPHPEQLVILFGKTKEFEHASVSYPNYLDWEKQSHSFSSMAAFRGENFNVTNQDEPERLQGYMISATFFSTLGVSPVMGRTISAQEDMPGGAPVALIGEGLWKRKFGASPSVLGRTMVLNGTGYAIIGVVPASFRLYSGDNPEVYVPIGQWTDPTFRDRTIGMGMGVIARLKPNVTLNQSRADVENVARVLAVAYPQADTGLRVGVLRLKDDMVGDIKGTLLILLAAVGFVLLIACTNVANLLLARSTGRTREFAVRSALGASHSRLIRQLLTESALLGVIGGALGLVLAAEATNLVLAAVPHAVPRAQEIKIDNHVLVFTLLASVLAGILFGLVPALKLWHTNLQQTLREGARGTSGTHQRAQNAFVIVEMAVALVLLVGAGLMIRSLAVLWGVNPGFDPHNVLTFSVTMPPSVTKNPAQTRAAIRQLHDAVRNTSGVEAASLTGGAVPMNGDNEIPFWLQGQPKPANTSEMNWALFYIAEPDYEKAMGLPLLSGRFISENDTETSAPVVVIDEYLAHKYFPNENPIGKRLNIGLLDLQPEIVGIAGHVKHWGLDRDSQQKVQAQLYVPLPQIPDRFWPLLNRGAYLMIRSKADPRSLLPALRASVSKVNHEHVIYNAQTFDQIISDSLAERRFAMVLLGLFAGLALLLSTIGIYGVISYLVGQRIPEIGTRMALGAQRKDVLQLILGRGMALATGGVILGSLLALILTRQMRSMIYGVTATDPLTFGGVALLLILIATAACYVPARRAMQIDPMSALRHE